jgi:hypothetical protein
VHPATAIVIAADAARVAILMICFLLRVRNGDAPFVDPHLEPGRLARLGRNYTNAQCSTRAARPRSTRTACLDTVRHGQPEYALKAMQPTNECRGCYAAWPPACFHAVPPASPITPTSDPKHIVSRPGP